jgi:hypothetical protein
MRVQQTSPPIPYRSYSNLKMPPHDYADQRQGIVWGHPGPLKDYPQTEEQKEHWAEKARQSKILEKELKLRERNEVIALVIWFALAIGASVWGMKLKGDYYAKRVVEEQKKEKQATPPLPKKKNIVA